MAKAYWVVLIFITILLAPCLAVSQEPNAQAASSEDNWPMFHHDAAHTGYTISTLPASTVFLWNFPTSASYLSNVAVSDGCAYFASYLDVGPVSVVFAVNASTGQLIWNSPDSSILFSVTPCPAVANGIVYTATDAYNASTGQLMFNYTSYGGNTSPIVAGGMLYIGYSTTSIPGIFALNAETGVSLWNFTVTGLTNHFPSGELFFPPAVTNGVVYFSDDGIYALNALTGSEIWHNTAIGDGWGSIAVANGYVYDNDEGQLYCLDASTGIEVWRYPSGVSLITPAVANGYVYAGSYTLNDSTGKMIWNNTMIQFSSPTVAGGVIYYPHSTHTDQPGLFDWTHEIYAFNASGEKIWNYTLPGLYASYFIDSPAIANSILYVSQSGGENTGVYAFGIAPSQTPTGIEFSAQTLWIVLPVSIFAIFLIAVLVKYRKKAKIQA
ncbi:MAG: PQQ-binding-like beta-propeller repeat protein [Candidatus Bathyarchaeia archaeon]|jgi:outer membrane protein assembly factor BamB